MSLRSFLFFLYFGIRTLRDERGLLVKLLIAGALGILISRPLDPVLGRDLNTVFSPSMYFCLASLTSIHLRNLRTGTWISDDLLLLAIFHSFCYWFSLRRTPKNGLRL